MAPDSPPIRLRAALLEPAKGLGEWPLALVTAPGGYGKSTLLSAWRDALRAEGRLVALLPVTPLHDDPGLFVEDIVGAIRESLGEREADTPAEAQEAFGADLMRRLGALAAGATPPEARGQIAGRLRRMLLRNVRDLGEPLTLMLDDYHLLPPESVADALVEVLLSGPGEQAVSLVVATRGRAPVAAARIVAEGRAIEVAAADLSLRADQVGALLGDRLAGRAPLGDELVPLVLAQTGGWAMGVQLAARALARRTGDQDPRPLLAELGRGDALFASLAGDLLDHEPAETVALLETAALLGAVDRETLRSGAVEQADPDGALRDALEKGLASQAEGRIAVHPLWQELLLARLRQRAPAEVVAARARRCAQLLERAGEPARAAELCRAFGLRSELAAMLERHGLSWVERGQHTSVGRWLDAARAQDDERADLRLIEGLIEARHDPSRGLALLDRAALLFHQAGRHDRELATLHNIVIVAGNAGRAGEARAAVLRLLGLRRLLTSSEARGVAVLFGAMAAFQRGRYRIARRLLKRADGYPLGPRERGAVAMGRSQLAFLAGRWREGLRAVDETLADPAQREHGPSYFTLRALRALGRGVLDLDRAQALAQLRSAQEALGDLRMRLTEGECAHHAARILLADGRPAEALPELERGLAHYAEIGEDDGRIASHALLSHAAWLAGDMPAAIAQARSALEGFRVAEDRNRLRFRFWTTALAARVLAEQGFVDEADRFVQRHARALDLPDAAACQHVAQLAIARVATLAGDAGRARRHLDRAAQARAQLEAPSPELDSGLLDWSLRLDAGEVPAGSAAQGPPAETPPLRIESFATLCVWLDGRAVESSRWRGHTTRRLLVRLLCAEGRPIERERLATELWPDADPARARGNLRVALSRLRRVLEPDREAGEPEAWLDLTATGVALSRRAVDAWDVRVWRECRAQARHALQAGRVDDALDLARRALADYRGAFVPDLYDEWALDLRDRLEDEMVGLGREAAAAALPAHPAIACELARHVVEHVPGDEGAWLCWARGLLAQGDRAAAVRTARRAEEALRRELDLETSAELRALVEEARRAR